MMSEPIAESLVRFKLFGEVSEEDENLTNGVSQEYTDSARSVFGAAVKTQRPNQEERNEGKLFKHTLERIDYSKGHNLFKELKEGDELRYINERDVSSWSHSTVMKTIEDLEEEIKFTFCRQWVRYVGHNLVKETGVRYFEVIFNICDLDADDTGSVASLESHIVRVAVKVLSRITYSQSLTQPRFEGKQEVRIKHGVGEHDFLMIEENKPVMKQIEDSSEAYNFKMYSYIVYDERLKQERSVVAIQCEKNRKFIMCTPGKKLSLVKDDDINDKMTNIASNSPYLFFLKQDVKDGDGTVLLESVAYPDKYLAYSPRGLQIKKLDGSEECIRRDFTFSLV